MDDITRNYSAIFIYLFTYYKIEAEKLKKENKDVY
jgi:hypothetical protein